MQCLVRGMISRQRDLVGQSHQLKFVIALDHAAARSHRRCTHNLQSRRGFGDGIAEDEAHGFFHAQPAGGDIQVFQSLRQELVGILVLLPGAHVGILAFRRIRQQFACPAFFKCRAYAERASLGRQHQGKQAFAAPPLHSGKVVERSAVGQKDCVEMVGRHELPRLFLTRCSFVDGDGLGQIFHGFQTGDRGRQGSACFLGAERRCECGQARARGNRAGLQKAAS